MESTDDAALFWVELASVDADESEEAAEEAPDEPEDSEEPAEEAPDDAPESEVAEGVAQPAAGSIATATERSVAVDPQRIIRTGTIATQEAALVEKSAHSKNESSRMTKSSSPLTRMCVIGSAGGESRLARMKVNRRKTRMCVDGTRKTTPRERPKWAFSLSSRALHGGLDARAPPLPQSTG